MSKIRAWSTICLLFLTNLFCLFGWAVASQQQLAWQRFAMAQDAVILQMDEELKGHWPADLCVEHPI